MNYGIVYIIKGADYAKLALQSIISLRLNGGTLANSPVIVYFVNKLHFEGYFNDLSCVCWLIPFTSTNSDQRQCCMMKSIVMQNIPFEKYIMLEADTIIIGDFAPLLNRIPNDGLAGVEWVDFKDHLQAVRKFLIPNNSDARQFALEMLGIDYGAQTIFPPIIETGVLGLSRTASVEIGKQLITYHRRLAYYTEPYDEVIINTIVFKLKIPIIKLHHGFNYRIEHLKKNKNDKDTAKIVHNKEFMVSPWTDVEHIKRKMATYGFSS